MVIPAGYCQVNMRFTGVSIPTGAHVTWGFDQTGGMDTPAEVANAVVEAWNGTDMTDFFSSNLTGGDVLCKFGPDATGPSAAVSGLGPGTGSSASVPPNVAVLMQKVTAEGGRAGRGRCYWPAIPEAMVDASGALDATFRSNFNTELGEFFGLFVLGGLIPVVLHGADSPLTTPTVFTQVVVASAVATQRRRLRR